MLIPKTGKYQLTMSCGMSGRCRPSDLPDFLLARQTPRFGFCWWFWLPSISANGGKFSKREVVDINIHWLCFSLSITWWPK